MALFTGDATSQMKKMFPVATIASHKPNWYEEYREKLATFQLTTQVSDKYLAILVKQTADEKCFELFEQFKATDGSLFQPGVFDQM